MAARSCWSCSRREAAFEAWLEKQQPITMVADLNTQGYLVLEDDDDVVVVENAGPSGDVKGGGARWEEMILPELLLASSGFLC